MATTVHLAGDGVSLEADLRGPPDGPCVLLMHGGGQTRHAWKKAAETLADEGYRSVTIDLRGHGGSDWSPDGIYGLESYVSDAACVIRQLPRPVALVGASMGGATGLMLAARQSEDVSALVLVDVTPRIDREGGDRIIAFMRGNEEGFASIDEAADAVAAYLPHRTRPADVSGLRKNLRTGSDGRLYWHWDPKLFGGASASREQMEEQLSAAAQAVTAPTLLVRGGMSEVVPPESAAHLLSLIPHAESVDIAGARHMVAGDRNDPFNDAVIEFLGRALGGSRGAPSGQASSEAMAG